MTLSRAIGVPKLCAYCLYELIPVNSALRGQARTPTRMVTLDQFNIFEQIRSGALMVAAYGNVLKPDDVITTFQGTPVCFTHLQALVAVQIRRGDLRL